MIDIVEEDGLVERCAAIGRHATERFLEMAERPRGDRRRARARPVHRRRPGGRPRDARARHRGLPEALDHALDLGLLTYFGGAGNVLKFKPPAVTSDEDIETMLDRCEDVIAFVERGVEAGRTGVRPDPLAAAT